MNSHIRNLRLRIGDDSDIHLIYGGALAIGVEAARRSFYIEGKSARESVDAALCAAAKFWSIYVGPVDHNKNLASLLCMLDSYFKNWDLNTDPLRPYQENAIEFVFALKTDIPHPETGRDIHYAGKFDMLGILDGVPIVVDEKTTGRGFWNFAEGWQIRSQFLGYIYACHMLEIPASRLMIRGCYQMKRGEDFTTAIIDVTQAQLERWWHQTYHDILVMVQQFRDLDFQYNFDDGCKAYNRPCAYLPLCSATRESDWISLYKTVVPWSPLNIPGGEL